MPPNTDYEYGVAVARRSENGKSGVRYIGRSEMVEFVCHDSDSTKRRVTSAKQRDDVTPSTTKFARVKSPKMRRRSDDVETDDDVTATKLRLRKRSVTFQLDEQPSRATTPELASVTSLPPIDAKPSFTESAGRNGRTLPPLQKSSSLDEKAMRRRLSPRADDNTMTSSKLSRRSSFTTTRSRKPEPISVESISTSAPSSPTTKRRFERVDSILQKMEQLSSEKMTSARSPMTSPRAPRTDRSSSNLFVDLDEIDEYKPDKNRLKFIQAALSSTTSPRFVRPGSGASSGRGSAPSSGRSSPLSLTQIGLSGECLLPELDSASGSRVTTPSNTPSASRASSAERRVRRRATTKSTREMVKEAITSLATSSSSKWYN